jgi:hypothetical protein
MVVNDFDLILKTHQDLHPQKEYTILPHLGHFQGGVTHIGAHLYSLGRPRPFRPALVFFLGLPRGDFDGKC